MPDLTPLLTAALAHGTCRCRCEPSTKQPAVRKWIVRRQREADGKFYPWSMWVVTAPSGRRRTFVSWHVMIALAPYFVLEELMNDTVFGGVLR